MSAISELIRSEADGTISFGDYTLDAKAKLDAVVNQVNQILNFYITGQDPNCTHDCSSCGGCH